MTEQELRRLIAQVIAELTASQQAPSLQPGPNALVLFSGALLGFEDAIAALTRLKAAGCAMDYLQTPSATRILDQDAIASVGMTPASESLVGAHDLLIVPTLTVNLAAKIVHGIGDCLASNVAAEFIMSGKPVVAAVTAACPDSAEKRSWFPAMPEGYRAMLRSNVAVLRSFGVRLAAAATLDKAVLKAVGRPGTPECAERVISEQLVKGFAPGSRVRIAKGAVVTALARDAARAANIVLERG